MHPFGEGGASAARIPPALLPTNPSGHLDQSAPPFPPHSVLPLAYQPQTLRSSFCPLDVPRFFSDSSFALTLPAAQKSTFSLPSVVGFLSIRSLRKCHFLRLLVPENGTILKKPPITLYHIPPFRLCYKTHQYLTSYC